MNKQLITTKKGTPEGVPKQKRMKFKNNKMKILSVVTGAALTHHVTAILNKVVKGEVTLIFERCFDINSFDVHLIQEKGKTLAVLVDSQNMYAMIDEFSDKVDIVLTAPVSLKTGFFEDLLEDFNINPWLKEDIDYLQQFADFNLTPVCKEVSVCS